MTETPHPLIGRVEVLVGQLRRRGIDVTTGAVIDAFTALTHLPLEEPESVKAGLRATLVKSADPTGEFDRAFRAVFAGAAAGDRTEIGEPSEEPPPVASPGQLSNALLQAMQHGDEAQIALLAQQAVDALAGLGGDAEHSERYYLHKVMRAIDLSRMLSAAMQQLRREGDLTELELMWRATSSQPCSNNSGDAWRSRSPRGWPAVASTMPMSTSVQRWPTATCWSSRRSSSASYAASCSRLPGNWQHGSAATAACVAPDALIPDERFADHCSPAEFHSMS